MGSECGKAESYRGVCMRYSSVFTCNDMCDLIYDRFCKYDKKAYSSQDQYYCPTFINSPRAVAVIVPVCMVVIFATVTTVSIFLRRKKMKQLQQ